MGKKHKNTISVDIDPVELYNDAVAFAASMYNGSDDSYECDSLDDDYDDNPYGESDDSYIGKDSYENEDIETAEEFVEYVRRELDNFDDSESVSEVDPIYKAWSDDYTTTVVDTSEIDLPEDEETEDDNDDVVEPVHHYMVQEEDPVTSGYVSYEDDGPMYNVEPYDVNDTSCATDDIPEVQLSDEEEKEILDHVDDETVEETADMWDTSELEYESEEVSDVEDNDESYDEPWTPCDDEDDDSNPYDNGEPTLLSDDVEISHYDNTPIHISEDVPGVDNDEVEGTDLLETENTLDVEGPDDNPYSTSEGFKIIGAGETVSTEEVCETSRPYNDGQILILSDDNKVDDMRNELMSGLEDDDSSDDSYDEYEDMYDDIVNENQRIRNNRRQRYN